MGKLYLCRHHVRFADFTAIPGEVVEAELTEAAEKRLLALGALEAVELDSGTDLPEDGESGETAPTSSDPPCGGPPSPEGEGFEAGEEDAEEEATEALAAAAAKACAAETPKRKRNQK